MSLAAWGRRSRAGCRLKVGAVIPVLVTRFSKSMKRAIRRSVVEVTSKATAGRPRLRGAGNARVEMCLRGARAQAIHQHDAGHEGGEQPKPPSGRPAGECARTPK